MYVCPTYNIYYVTVTLYRHTGKTKGVPFTLTHPLPVPLPLSVPLTLTVPENLTTHDPYPNPISNVCRVKVLAEKEPISISGYTNTITSTISPSTGRCYLFNIAGGRYVYDEAKAFCDSWGAHIPSFHSDTELNFVYGWIYHELVLSVLLDLLYMLVSC